MSNTVAASTGSVALSYPAWAIHLSSQWSIIVAVLGAVVLLLTIWNKVLEIKMRRKSLREKE
jgi:uncharacterized integral membrane protein